MAQKRCNYMIAWNLTKLPFIELPMWFIMNLSLERIQWRSSLSINPMLWCFMNKFMWSAWHLSSAMLEDHLDYSLAFLFWQRVFNALTNRSQDYLRSVLYFINQIAITNTVKFDSWTSSSRIHRHHKYFRWRPKKRCATIVISHLLIGDVDRANAGSRQVFGPLWQISSLCQITDDCNE